MPENQIARSPDIQRLVDEGYSVVIEGQYIVVEGVPFVTADREVARGDLISHFVERDGVAHVEGDHTAWFTGIPYTAAGQSLESAMLADTNVTEVGGRRALCRLSYKSERPETIADFYGKFTHYIRKFQGHANVIDPKASASSNTGSISVRQAKSVFLYPNAAISRSGLDAYEAKLMLRKVAIVGVGGTGSYILDALAKTPVDEIHLYDGDKLESATGFRMPGTLPVERAHDDVFKTDYLRDLYSGMRVGVFSHPERITSENLAELDDCNFVFIAIDHGPSRGQIAKHLHEKGVSFIDVGIGVDKVPEDIKLLARVRVTAIDSEHGDLLAKLPTADDSEDAVYNNIQVVELNALNAMLAMILYKQKIGFYAAEVPVQDLRYRVSFQSLSHDGVHIV